METCHRELCYSSQQKPPKIEKADTELPSCRSRSKSSHSVPKGCSLLTCLSSQQGDHIDAFRAFVWEWCSDFSLLQRTLREEGWTGTRLTSIAFRRGNEWLSVAPGLLWNSGDQRFRTRAAWVAEPESDRVIRRRPYRPVDGADLRLVLTQLLTRVR